MQYSKPCVKRPLSKRTKIGFQEQLSLNAGQTYRRMLSGEHSAILSTFIKLSFVIKIFVLSIFEWPLKTGFTLYTLWALFLLQLMHDPYLGLKMCMCLFRILKLFFPDIFFRILSCTFSTPDTKSAEWLYQKINFLFLKQNICCAYSNEPSRWDGFEHQKYILNWMGKKIIKKKFTLKNCVYLTLWSA